jgi:RNA polymerase-binding transcription factor DksA
MKVNAATHPAASLLRANRRWLLAATENLDKPNHELMENWSEAIDLAQAVAARDTSEALRHLLDELQQDVKRALTRLESGCYGVCEDCSRAISLERLRALPEATRCVECQRRRNRSPGMAASA